VVRLPAGAKDSSFLQRIQTNAGSHPVSYSVDTGDSFLQPKPAELKG